MIGMKQEVLAFELGPNQSQKKISVLEIKQEIDKDLIKEISNILDIPANLIYQFSEEWGTCLFNQIPTRVEDGKYFAFFIEKWLTSIEENNWQYLKQFESEKDKVNILERNLEYFQCNHFEISKNYNDS